MALSGPLLSYRNDRIAGERAEFARVRAIRDQADALGRKIYLAAEGVERELRACEVSSQQNKANAKLREKLFSVLGQGIDLGQKLLAESASEAVEDVVSQVGPVSSTASPAATTEPAATQSATQSVMLVDGAAIGKALSDVFASPRDYPVSCTAAERFRNEGETARIELDLALKQYPSVLANTKLPSVSVKQTEGAKSP